MLNISTNAMEYCGDEDCKFKNVVYTITALLKPPQYIPLVILGLWIQAVPSRSRSIFMCPKEFLLALHTNKDVNKYKILCFIPNG